MNIVSICGTRGNITGDAWPVYLLTTDKRRLLKGHIQPTGLHEAMLTYRYHSVNKLMLSTNQSKWLLMLFPGAGCGSSYWFTSWGLTFLRYVSKIRSPIIRSWNWKPQHWIAFDFWSSYFLLFHRLLESVKWFVFWVSNWASSAWRSSSNTCLSVFNVSENSTQMYYVKLLIEESAIGNITDLLRPFVNDTNVHVDDLQKTTGKLI